MSRVGIGGVLYMETDQGAPRGPAGFAGPLWRSLFQHLCAEAGRLGLQVNVNNDAGWCGSGGPWITPELSMQRLVWTETNVIGPRRFDAELPQPKANRGFYRDIAVFAFPTPAAHYTIPHLAGKSAATTLEIPLHSTYSELSSEAMIPRNRVVVLSEPLSRNGRVSWDVPAGSWTLLRLGHTTTGKDNHPAPLSGRGLECDKLSKAAAEAAFEGLMSKIIADSKPLVGRNKTLVSTHIDSWEVGSQNWTPGFRQEFQRLRGYDPFPYLPVLAGHVIDTLEISERFLWDVRMTVSDLLVENYAGHFQALARRNGIRLSIEAYGEPADDLTYAGRADEPMAEFWSWNKFGAADTCCAMASAAHVYGKRILGAEAFTANDGERWRWHPGMFKDLGDWAFCEGINRFVFHRYALQPWADVRPGMSMGPWGLHYERTQTWWEQSRAWHEYLARCQFLLQQGLAVADLCFLAPEMSPQSFKSPVKSGHDRPGYGFDGCSPEVVLTRFKVKNGRLVLPDGMSYRMLVLPQAETMTPKLLGKIQELVAQGATVVGAPPAKSPSLSDYPACDGELKRLVAELWGSGEPPAELTAHPFGKGRIYWGGEFKPAPVVPAASENQLGAAKWIWRAEGNPIVSAPPGKRFFCRVVQVEAVPVRAARLVMTADNRFECRLNGRIAGSGNDWGRAFEFDVKPFLRPGTNLLEVTAVNTTDSPSPAGLIGLLRVTYADDRILEVPTDGNWLAAEKLGSGDSSGPWTAAKELGPVGTPPWRDQSGPVFDPIPDINLVSRLLGQLGVPPDFTAQTRNAPDGFRFIHRTVDGTDFYFVANKNGQAEEGLCSFRVGGRRPELWWPDTGRTERVAVYEAAEGLTRMPLRLDPYGSVFVMFRKGARAERDRLLAARRDGVALLDTSPASAGAGSVEGIAPLALTGGPRGAIAAVVSQPGSYLLQSSRGTVRRLEVSALPAPVRLERPWEVRFAPGWGAPEKARFDRLLSWSEHPDPGIKYFSGSATYTTTFTLTPGLLANDHRLYLDLGKVAVIAEVKLNGKDLGILWKAPFAVEITGAVRRGQNTLEVKVVNLWINRQIGDEQLAEDSERKPDGTLKSWPAWLQAGQRSPTGRFTFTSWRLWKKNDPLVESGLLGPVEVRVAKAFRL